MSAAPKRLSAYSSQVLSLLALPFIGTAPLLSQTLYWDTNGSTPGADGPSPSGLWNTTATTFSTESTGTTAPVSWANSGAATAIFAAGSDATGPYTVTLGAGIPLNLAGLTVQSGQLTLASQTADDTLNFGTLPATISIAGGASLLLQAASTGTGGLVKTGTGILELDAASAPGGNYTVNAGELRIASGTTISAGTLSLGGSAGNTSTLTLAAGSTLNLDGNISFLNANTPLAATIQGPGSINLNGSRTITVQNIGSLTDLTIAAVLADGSESSGITKNGPGTLVLQGANTYSGATLLNIGSLIIQGNSGSIASSSELNIAAALTATIGSLADTASVNRLGDTADITLNSSAAGGSTLIYNGPDLAVAGIHQETAGTLTWAGNHRNSLTLQPGDGDQVELRFSSLIRTENPTGYVRGNQLGSAAGTANSSRLFFDTAPTLTGGIVPWLIVHGLEENAIPAFATYDATTGLKAQTGTVAPGSATTGSNVLKSAAGTVSINTSVNVNSWTNSATGNTNLGANVTLGIQSGALLFTSNGNINSGTLDLGSAHPGFFHLVSTGNVTAAISSTITGTQGLTLSGSGTGTRTLTLSGNNTFTGGVNVYTGILNITNAGALNANGTNSLTVQMGGSVRLNGNSITVSGLEGNGNINSFTGSTTAILRVNGGGQFDGTLTNGTNGTLGLTKSGTTALVLAGANTYTGPTVVQNGVLHINATGGNAGTNGSLIGTSSIHVQQGAVLRINNGNANNNNTNRLDDTAPITLSGGTLNFTINGNNIAYSETVGVITLTAGASQISSGQAGDAGGTSTLTISGLATRPVGATLNFSGTGLGTNLRNRVEIGGLTPGFLGGWATVGNDFAKYVADLDSNTVGNQGSVTALTAAEYTTTHANDATTPWSATIHAKPAADQAAAQGINTSREVLSLVLANGIDLTQGGGTLAIISGGLIKLGGTVNTTAAGNRSQINGGTLTAGNSSSAAELFVRVTGANLNIGSVIANNAQGGSVTFVKSGAGTVNLSAANTFTGGVFLNEGSLRANNTTGSATGTGSIVTALGTTFGGSGLITPAANASITVNGSLSIGNLNDTAAADLGIAISGTGTLALNSIVQFDLFTNAGTGTLNPLTAADLLDIDAPSWANISLGSASTLQVATSLTSTSFVAGDSWKLFDWAGIADGTPLVQGSNGFALLDLPTLANGLYWDTSELFTTGYLIVAIPEPGRASLILAGIALGFLRRRR
ncbi:putative secreted protein with PEP-CTERM sorting signal [Prosthecobacter fusiformis]|uniref:Putative secreted protein with PEP-CTERM sorting signal n=1 Tax=Prosthecobacter fusiformis TaxID=48464 RepID=A0A4R7RMD1_9BACT|nr:autotransporter-associated beta strand repeat-containing protein [Prosthecobacter fusiformis]TDU66541.1 putative secreted protein with PEP-CTERM sorting signal [Prosthecobacter fusiformis]